MKIDPRFLIPHLHAAATDQLADELTTQGYEVTRELAAAADAAAPRIDLAATRGGEKVFYEIKVIGDRREAPDGKLSRIAAMARAAGARFHLLLVQPSQSVDVSVDGLEEALRRTLPQALDINPEPLARPIKVLRVADVVIERLQVRGQGHAMVGGNAVAEVAQDVAGGSPLVSPMPFAFEILLDAEGRLVTEFVPQLILDTSELVGQDALAK